MNSLHRAYNTRCYGTWSWLFLSVFSRCRCLLFSSFALLRFVFGGHINECFECWHDCKALSVTMTTTAVQPPDSRSSNHPSVYHRFSINNTTALTSNYNEVIQNKRAATQFQCACLIFDSIARRSPHKNV